MKQPVKRQKLNITDLDETIIDKLVKREKKYVIKLYKYYYCRICTSYYIYKINVKSETKLYEWWTWATFKWA